MDEKKEKRKITAKLVNDMDDLIKDPLLKDKLTEEERAILKNIDKQEIFTLVKFFSLKEIANMQKMRDNKQYQNVLELLGKIDFAAISRLCRSSEISSIMRQANFSIKLKAIDAELAKEFDEILHERLAYNKLRGFDSFVMALRTGVRAIIKLYIEDY